MSAEILTHKSTTRTETSCSSRKARLSSNSAGFSSFSTYISMVRSSNRKVVGLREAMTSRTSAWNDGHAELMLAARLAGREAPR